MTQTTTDHETIRRWVEERGGWPARVKATGSGGDGGILRIDFPDYSGEQSLERIEWDQFFEGFDASELAFIYQDRTSRGQQSRFSKLVSRAGVAEREGGRLRRQTGGATEDALELLETQHRQIESLGDDLFGLEPDSAELGRTFLELADALAIHTTIEERIFYPAVKSPETAELLEESVDDHLRAKQVLAALMEAAPRGLTEPQLEQLVELTETHMIDEEQELFPLVRKLLSEDERAQLARQMEALVQQLQDEGEPRKHVPEETAQAAPI
jgi:iron-sulfur cluster repair protein YtfE (RIC family)